MAKFTLRQGNVTAKLSEVSYQPAEGFQQDNTWHVAEESISAESDTKLRNGPATIQHGGINFPVTVTVLEFEMLPARKMGAREGRARLHYRHRLCRGLAQARAGPWPLLSISPRSSSGSF
jgi:hypothetical protein